MKRFSNGPLEDFSLANGGRVLILIAAWFCQASIVRGDLKSDVREALAKSCRYYFEEVASHGGYVYYYSPDLTTRLGEGPATPTQIWVQPPGTPTVGLAYLAAYDATGEPFYLQAAMEAGQALLYGRLQSGCWTNSIDFDPKGKTAAYRNGKGIGRNFSTLDDGISQTALQFLMKLDQATGFRNQLVHSETLSALKAFLAAQHSNGAFPQGWDEVAQTSRPQRRATFPKYDWKTEGRIKNYWDMATLNDRMAGTITQTLLTAHRIYESGRAEHEQTYLPRLRRFGDFLIAAQLPEPQPGWAQQYNDEMNPIWARRFEPPAVAGRESQDVISSLLVIAEVTGEAKYLEPIPSALSWLQRSQLPNGQLARYYELQTNRPLYMTRSGKQYSLTYDDSRLPSHYGWKVENRIGELRRRYLEVSTTAADAGVSRPDQAVSESLVLSILNQLDSQGRWISEFSGEALPGQPKFRPGDRYLSSQVFADNVIELAAFLRQP